MKYHKKVTNDCAYPRAKSPSHARLLPLLAWQASIYCIWGERNGRLHRSRFRTSAAVIKEIHNMIKLKIAAIRVDDPQLASAMFQTWIS